MGCVEKREIFHGLRHGAGAVLPGDAQGSIELGSAELAPLPVDTLIALRKGKVGCRGVSFLDMMLQGLAQQVGGFPGGGDLHMPGLGVAPGRRALRHGEDALQRFLGKGALLKGAGAEALLEDGRKVHACTPDYETAGRAAPRRSATCRYRAAVSRMMVSGRCGPGGC